MIKKSYKMYLTEFQSIFYYTWKKSPERSDYNMVVEWIIDGKLNVEQLNKSIIRFINDHLLINCNVSDTLDDETPFWIERPKLSDNETIINYIEHPLADNDIMTIVNLPIDLENDLLVRYTLIRETENRHRLLMVHAHIITDGSSADELFDSYCDYYKDCSYKIKDSIEQQRLNLQNLHIKLSVAKNENIESINEFWINTLNNISSIDTSFLRNTKKQKFDFHNEIIKESKFEDDKDKTIKIKNIGKKYGITPYMFSQIAFAILIYKITGKKKFGFSFPVAILEGKELTYGAHVNTMIIGFDIDNSSSLNDIIGNTKLYYKELKTHKAKYQPITEVIKLVDDNKILDIAFIQTSLREKPIDLGEGLSVTVCDEHHIDLVNSIVFEQEQIGGVIKYRIRYDGSILDEILVENFTKMYCKLSEHMLADLLLDQQNKKISEYNIEDLVESSNIHKQDLYIKKDINTINIKLAYEQIAKLYTNQEALFFNGKRISYKELNTRANQLANYLISEHAIKPNDYVVLCLDRSDYMIVGILAVIKAGGAYVPVDPLYPSDRISYVCDDTQTKIILTNHSHQEKISEIIQGKNVYAACIDNPSFEKETQKSFSSEDPQVVISPEDAAYVIYTSGTTGKPKGVIVEHGNVTRLFSATDGWFKFTESDVWTLFHSYTFDFSVWEIWGALLYGGKLVIPTKEETRDLDLFYNLCLSESVTVLNQTPNAFYQFTDIAIQKCSHLDSLRYIIFGGEALNLVQLKPWFAAYKEGEPTLINMYGITETTVHVTYKVIHESELDCGSLIGVPIPDETIYVLDNDKRLLPVGALGELYVGGAGVARGYLNRPELTVERFIDNPFQTEREKAVGYNSRLYKSGDLVRLLPDGNLEYIGRNDFQVKIRGFRIELGEIESRISSYPGIKQSAVFAKEHISGSSKYLAAYYVADEKVNDDSLTEHLKDYLPDYMVPSIFIHMTEFPLTLNGKLDRKALPEPYFAGSSDYVAPGNEMERILCEIYAGVLGLEKSTVGTTDDFFKLGGDSISSIRLVNQIRQKLDLKVTVKEIFSNKTIKSLCMNVLSGRKDSLSDIHAEQGVLDGESQLLPIQEWFFNNIEMSLFKDGNHYNQSFAVRVPSLDRKTLESSITKLVGQHDALRFHYNNIDGSIKQYYSHEIPEVSIEYYNSENFTMEQLSKKMEEWQRGFNIFSGTSLFKVCYIENSESEKALLMFFFHHLIIDSVSWRIIKDDLLSIYEGLLIGKTLTLGNKTSSYRQWAQAIKNDYNKTNETEYWETIRRSIKISNEKLTSLTIGNGKTDHISFKKEITKRLLRDVNDKLGTNINDILLSALGLSLRELTGLKENHVLLEGHGRENVFQNLDITNTVGWFTSMYPVALPVNDYDTKEIVTGIKESLHKIPNNGLGYGILYGYGNDELPYITFNYLGQFDNNEKQEDWSFVHMDMGKTFSDRNKDKSIISFNGGVFDGELQFYIKSTLAEETHVKLIESYKLALQLIVENLSNENRTYLTLSDVNEIISKDYLNEIQYEKEIESVYLANSLQQGFIFHSLNLGTVDDAYHVQITWSYSNMLDLSKLREAWSYAQKKFGALRLRFAWKEELIQIIDKQGELKWIYNDFSKELDKGRLVSELIAEDRNHPFDLSQGNLFRVYLIKLNEEEYTCVFSSHHAIMDGWSMPILIKYIHDAYINLLHGEAVNTSLDNAYGEAQKFLQENKSLNDEFWQSYVGKVDFREDLTSLLLSNKRNVTLSEYKHIKEPKELELEILGEKYTGLKSFCSNGGFTLNAALQYCWHKLLSVYGACDTTIVGTTVAGRSLPINDIESSVGLYINTLPVIFEHRSGKVIELIQELQGIINEVNSRSDMSLASLQSGGNRLFNSLFVFENYPIEDQDGNTEISLKVDGSIEKVDYPLGVTAFEQGDKLIVKLQYASEIFDKEMIRQLLDGIGLLLEQLIESPTIRSNELILVTSGDFQKLVYDWNDTFVEYPSHKTLHALFEEQVEKTPDKIAVTYNEVNLTYRELNEQANQLANYLKAGYEIKPDDLVMLCLDRSDRMLVGILAALKTGAAYVPIDFSYPDDRITFIASDTKAKFILTNNKYAERLGKLVDMNVMGLEVIDEILTIEKIGTFSVCNPQTETTGANLAYIIYTSGTTGQPKGVMVEHRNIVNLVLSLPSKYRMEDEEVILFFANYVFDTSVEQIFLSLISGNRLLVAYHEMWENSERFLNVLESENVTHVDLTPSFLAQFNIESVKSLKRVISGGEAINEQLYNRLTNAPFMFFNSYGLTETGVTSAIGSSEQAVNIGRAINNTSIYILDENLSLLPIGAIGELYIGGEGISRGYLNNQEMTSQRFIRNIYTTECCLKNNYNSTIYRTGDLVRYTQNGILEYVGRNDLQIKIRGFRVELGEVESKIVTIENIKQSVVVAINDGASNYLVAYYVSDIEFENKQLEAFLRKELPDYMVPRLFCKLETLPLTINGKINFKKLPKVDFEIKDSIKVPTTPNEKIVATILATILKIDYCKINVDENFFTLGGNSILAISFLSRINKEFNSDCRISDLYKYSSISDLANSIKSTSFKPIVLFSNSKPYSNNIVMIHPGGAGCEVYASLCNQLKNKFNCLGVDSFNLYNDNKITDLHELADFYLDELDKSIRTEQTYRFIGWSLGGLVALEMAYILESRGFKNIHVYLLDTVIYDATLKKQISSQGELYNERYLESLSKYEMDISTVKRYLNAEELISTQQVSGKLENTKITLFKAKKGDDSISNETNLYIQSLQYNNIDKYVSLENLSLISLKNCSHYDILKEEKSIVENIKD